MNQCIEVTIAVAKATTRVPLIHCSTECPRRTSTRRVALTAVMAANKNQYLNSHPGVRFLCIFDVCDTDLLGLGDWATMTVDL